MNIDWLECDGRVWNVEGNSVWVTHSIWMCLDCCVWGVLVYQPCFARSYGRSILPNNPAFCQAWQSKQSKYWCPCVPLAPCPYDRLIVYTFCQHVFVVSDASESFVVMTWKKITIPSYLIYKVSSVYTILRSCHITSCKMAMRRCMKP